MTMLIDIKAFLVSARTGGLSAAAREINTTPSVITKRVNRLEGQVGVKLFNRSTRSLSLTPEGKRIQPQLQLLVAELEETLKNLHRPSSELRGSLRLRAPTTIGSQYVGKTVAQFQKSNPDVTVEFMLMDRQVNPVEEGFDISLGASPQSFAGVEETPLCPYPRVLVGSKEYFEGREIPTSPADIIDHDCLAYVPVGYSWLFVGPSGRISVDIRARYTVNDSRNLMDAVNVGLGLTVVPEYLAREEIEAGRLISLLTDFPLEPLWLKAMIPRHKANKPEVVALLAHLKQHFETPPWDISQ